MNVLLHVFLLFCLLVGIVGLFICSNNKLYCKIYLRKEWEMWELVCANLHNATFCEHYYDKNYPEIENYSFIIPLNGINCDLIYWVITDRTSLHLNKECLLSGFDKYHSDLVTKWIKEQLKNEVS